MAIVIETQISGQVLDSGNTDADGVAGETYVFLYEPFPVIITETDPEATQINVRLQKVSNVTGITEFSESNYATFDYNQSAPLHVDLMEIIRQEYQADIYKYGSIDELVVDSKNIVHDLSFRLLVTSDTSEGVGLGTQFALIIGSRPYKDFTGLVDGGVHITEFQKYGIDITSRWKDYPTIIQSLKEIDALNDFRPNLSSVINTEGECPCGGMVYWKSRRGGWMQWGFDIKSEKPSGSYQRGFQGGFFDVGRDVVDGIPHIPVDYTSFLMNDSVNLKSLALTQAELFAVSSISQSPIVYYLDKPGGNLELMKLASATHPINNQANGGDFSVSLKSISSSTINVR